MTRVSIYFIKISKLAKQERVLIKLNPTGTIYLSHCNLTNSPLDFYPVRKVSYRIYRNGIIEKIQAYPD